MCRIIFSSIVLILNISVLILVLCNIRKQKKLDYLHCCENLAVDKNTSHKFQNHEEVTVTGRRNCALGEDAVCVPDGRCRNSDIVPEADKTQDPNNPINRCIFCRDGINCYFAGECENKMRYEK